MRKVIRSDATTFSYHLRSQPRPKLGPWTDELDRLLAANEAKSKRERLTLQRIFEALADLGYGGGYDAVRRYAKAWRRRWSSSMAQSYVPLVFDPGEAYQFDWSHEFVVLAGVTTKLKAAHVRLCHSRMFLVRAYPRESPEMVFDAHDRAFRLFQGACRRGIYDNMKTAVQTVLIGKDRVFNRRFLQMCGHYLVEPVACTPGAGWEKGQVENQVGMIRGPVLHPATALQELRRAQWLAPGPVRRLRLSGTPTRPSKTRRSGRCSKTSARPCSAIAGRSMASTRSRRRCRRPAWCASDSNKYSVAARAVGRPVEVYAYAERIVIRQDGEFVAEHARRFRARPDLLRPVALRAPCSPGSRGRYATARRSRTGRCPAPWGGFAPGSLVTTMATGIWSRSSPPCWRMGWRRWRRPVPRRWRAACAAPTSFSTSSIVGASRLRRRRSRRPRACVFATSRWPIAPATTA